MRARVVVVLVTYNREHLVTQSLDALAAQTVPPAAVVVIDNASTDASGDRARRHGIGADVVTLAENHGGAGGFAAGIARVLDRHAPQWLWLMDDDTITRPDTLETLLAANAAHGDRADVLASTPVWTDGREHPMNTSRQRVGARPGQLASARRVGARAIRTASFVSVLLRADAVRRHGLPLADYFIWSDDFEYTGRLLREGQGLRVAGSVVEHRTPQFAGATTDPGDRFYFDVRNRLWALGRTSSFRWWEKALYGGRSVFGWLRTLREHPRLRPLALRAVRDAVRAGPRPTRAVLRWEPAVSDAVRQWERR